MVGSEARSPSCDWPRDIRFTDATAKAKSDELTLTMQRGLSGTKYNTGKNGYVLYNNTECFSGYYEDTYGNTQSRYDMPGYYAAQLWVEYECGGIAVNTVVYGPFPNAALDKNKADLEVKVLATGVKIAYVAYEKVDGSQLSYIVFYTYVENPSNARQAAAVAALRNASQFNRYSGNSKRPLSDTLRIAKKVVPGISERSDLEDAETLIQATRRFLK
jgi:hypothetical protein